jgi:hypothetical protein
MHMLSISYLRMLCTPQQARGLTVVIHGAWAYDNGVTPHHTPGSSGLTERQSSSLSRT